MKTRFVLSVFVAVLFVANSCKPTKKVTYPTDCSTLVVDLEAGTLNGISPRATPEEVKKALTCFTGETEEGSWANCGGGVFFLKHGFFFYTHRDYFEVRSNFTGSFASESLLGKSESYVIEKLGEPDEKPDFLTYFYKRKYGTLRIELLSDEVKEIGVHAKKMEDVELCR